MRGVWFYVIMFWCDFVNNVSLLFYLLFGQVVSSGWRVFFELSLFCLMCRGIIEIVIIII